MQARSVPTVQCKESGHMQFICALNPNNMTPKDKRAWEAKELTRKKVAAEADAEKEKEIKKVAEKADNQRALDNENAAEEADAQREKKPDDQEEVDSDSDIGKLVNEAGDDDKNTVIG